MCRARIIGRISANDGVHGRAKRMSLSRDTAVRRSFVLALAVPADGKRSVEVVLVASSSVAFSDVIGGGLVDDVVTGVCEGDLFEVYLDAEREAKGLPTNNRAAVLLTRLGHEERNLLAGLRGDVLVVGLDPRGSDADLPAGVLVAACQSGLRVDVDMDAVERTP
jgi:hypothetical protein